MIPRTPLPSRPRRKEIAPRAATVSSRVPNPIASIIPNSLTTTLTYYDFFNLATGGVAAWAVYPFRANSCRDPYASVGGGSPSGFTQLGYLYRKIKVTSVKAHVWGYQTCGSPLIIGLFFRSSNNSAFGSPVEAQQTLMEFPNLSTTATLPPYVAGMAHPRFVLNKGRTIPQIEGHAVNDEDYSSTFGVEPNTQCYVDLVIVSADGVSVSSTANAHVQLTYTVTVSEPNQTYTD